MITNVKTLNPTFDIHRSKLIVAQWHFAKAGKTLKKLVFPLIWVIIHKKIIC
jgi:hypothetical protein